METWDPRKDSTYEAEYAAKRTALEVDAAPIGYEAVYDLADPVTASTSLDNYVTRCTTLASVGPQHALSVGKLVGQNRSPKLAPKKKSLKKV